MTSLWDIGYYDCHFADKDTEVKRLAQGHQPTKAGAGDLSPDLVDPKFCEFNAERAHYLGTLYVVGSVWGCSGTEDEACSQTQVGSDPSTATVALCVTHLKFQFMICKMGEG